MWKNDEEIFKKVHQNPFLFHVYKKVHVKRENALILVTGKVQKGKSTVARKVCWDLDRTFNIDRVVWEPVEFVDALMKKMKRGNAINFEEIGTESGGIPKRKWFAFNNLVINDILQTFGFEGLIVVFTVPTLKYVDSNALTLIDYRIKVIDKDLNDNTNICKIYRTEYDEDQDKIYRYKLKNPLTNQKVGLYKMRQCNSKKLENDYAIKEAEFKKNIQIKIKQRMKKDFTESESEEKIYREAEKRIDEFVRTKGKRVYIHKPSLENEFNLGETTARRIKTRLEKKLKTSA